MCIIQDSTFLCFRFVFPYRGEVYIRNEIGKTKFQSSPSGLQGMRSKVRRALLLHGEIQEK